MNIGIIGMGIVGSATGGVFSRVHKVYGYDKYKIDFNKENNILKLSENAEVVFLCVPTPMQKDGKMDDSAINESLELLNESVKKTGRKAEEIIIVIRSTSIPGTCDKIAKKYNFKFATNPEFLTEKAAFEDMEKTNRIVIWVNDDFSRNKLLGVYKTLFPKAEYVIVNRKTAEMIKYTANTFLASQIGIANEIYKICEALGVDYQEVKKAILLDERIARNINVPGPDGDFGFGGKCFPKDLNALIKVSEDNGHNPELLKEVWNLNMRIRKNKDWMNIPGAISENKEFKKK